MTLLILLSGLVLASLLIVPPVQAQVVCQVCTVAVVAGLGLSRYLGIDDTVSGVWFGGFIVTAGMWLAYWLRSKHYKIPFLYPLALGGMFVLTVAPMFFMDLFGHAGNKLWGIDKLLLGLCMGAIVFVKALIIDKLLRSYHDGKVYVPYQKVILPVGFLLIASLVFYFITRN